MVIDDQQKRLLCVMRECQTRYLKYVHPFAFKKYGNLVKAIKECDNDDDFLNRIKHDPYAKLVFDLDEFSSHYQHNFGEELIDLYREIIRVSSDTKTIDTLNVTISEIEEELIKPNLSLIDSALGYIDMASGDGSQNKTGIEWLDKTLGWIPPGTVTRIAAYSNTGKTRFMYRLIINQLKQGKTVEIYSLEVPVERLTIELASAYLEVNTTHVLKGLYNADVEKFYKDFGANLHIFDSTHSFKDIAASVNAIKSDIVFIDYVQNIDCPGKSTIEKMEYAASNIQKLALRTKKPIIDLSQTPNGSADSWSLGDALPAKGSGALVAACDVGLFLYIRDGEWRCAIAKNKFGVKDVEFVIHANMGACTFEYKGCSDISVASTLNTKIHNGF